MCAGTGRLKRGGYNKRTRVDITRIVGSKWTSMQETMGWRHFVVIQCRKRSGGVVFVQMQASCDGNTQLWLNAANLKDRDLWAAGWLQKSEMQDPDGSTGPGVPCRACRGTGTIACPTCDGTGAVLMRPSALPAGGSGLMRGPLGGLGPEAQGAAGSTAAAVAGPRSQSPLPGGPRLGRSPSSPRSGLPGGSRLPWPSYMEEEEEAGPARAVEEGAAAGGQGLGGSAPGGPAPSTPQPPPHEAHG